MSRMDDEIARRERVKMMASYLQAYLDDQTCPLHHKLVGQKITMQQALDFCNDFLLYSNDGEELTTDMKVQ